MTSWYINKEKIRFKYWIFFLNDWLIKFVYTYKRTEKKLKNQIYNI